MSPKERAVFDLQLERVLVALPRQVTQFLEEVPLVVDDAPSTRLMRQLDIEFADELCGLHSGIPLTEQSIDHSGVHTSVVHIFRAGILAAASNEKDSISLERLRHEIRATILHEYGHHVGLTEQELQELGYG